ncbi:3659_t:CDS:2, partial [Entrophospora sp. SA101]
ARAGFSEDDTLVKILISDCGGNARAMEALKDTIEMLGNLSSDVAQDIARVILTHKKLRHDQYISNIVRKTPEQLVQPGLIQFHKIELRTKIANAWIFCVSLENGWSLITGEKGSTAIGTRMLCQCLAQSLEAIITNYEAPYPYDVFELVAKHYKKKLEDCTIFLVVDGLHQLMSEQANGTDKNSDFYRTLTNIGDLAMRGVFCLPCITATVFTPITSFLASSHQK